MDVMTIAAAIFVASIGVGIGIVLAAMGYVLYKESKEND